jgi:hypothetical protein
LDHQVSILPIFFSCIASLHIRNYFIPLLEHYDKTSHETEKFPYHVMDHQRRIVQNDNITPVPGISVLEDGTILDKDGHQLPGPIYSLDDRIDEPPFTLNTKPSTLSRLQKNVSCFQKPTISCIDNDGASFSPTVTFKPLSNNKMFVQHSKGGINTLTHINEHSIRAEKLNQENPKYNLRDQQNIIPQTEYLNISPNVFSTTQDSAREDQREFFSPETSTKLIPFNQKHFFGAQNTNKDNLSYKGLEDQNMYYSPTPYVITQKGDVQNAENGDILHGFTAGPNNTILGPDDRPVWNARITPTGHVELLTHPRCVKSSAYLGRLNFKTMQQKNLKFFH